MRMSREYEQDALDIFTGNDLKDCQDFELPQMCHFEIKNYNIGESGEADNPEGWMGKYVEIGFHNQSRIHCDIFKVGQIKEMEVDLVVDKHVNCTLIN